MRQIIWNAIVAPFFVLYFAAPSFENALLLFG